MKKTLFMACLFLIGTSVMAKPTIEQLKKAIAKPQGVFKENPCKDGYGSGYGYRAVLKYIEIINEGNYNKQYDYHPYMAKVTITCYATGALMKLPGQKTHTVEVEARIKIYKDDFGKYVASWY